MKTKDTVMSDDQIYKSYSSAPSIYRSCQNRDIAGHQAEISFRAGQEAERERILTDDVPIDVLRRMELWWYEPENNDLIIDLVDGEFDKVSVLTKSFIKTLKQALTL